MIARITAILLLLFLAMGCTARLTADISIMKQWDRPNEVWRTETK